MRMSTAIDVSYVAATALATVYVLIALATVAKGRNDVLYRMAGDLFAYAMATALGAAIAGELLASNGVSVADLITIAIPFGMAAAALHAFARRDRTSPTSVSRLHLAAFGVAIVLPFAAGFAG
jgi:hypothetical protein